MPTMGGFFSGIGGFEKAFRDAGFDVKWCVEIEADCHMILRRHFPEAKLLGDIRQIMPDDLENVDAITFGSPCFIAGTLVMTRGGLVPIERIRPGDIVYTHKNRWRTVLKSGSSISKTIIVKGAGHYGLECTKDHPFLSCEKGRYYRKKVLKYYVKNENWTRAIDMPGRFWATPTFFDKIHIPKIPKYKGSGVASRNPNITPEFMEFIGLWLGDGWLRMGEKKSSIIICSNSSQKSSVIKIIENAGLKISARIKDRTVWKFTISNTMLARWLLSNFGQYSHGKKMPVWVNGMSRNMKEALLDGLFASDGHVYKHARVITTCSKALAISVRLLTESLGMSTSIIRHIPRRGGVVIESRKCKERIYYQVFYRNSKRSLGVRRDKNRRFTKVRRVILCSRPKVVYNLEVEDDNSYVADGIIVHNCQSLSVAGKREGFNGVSGIFFEAIRLIKALQPRFVLWENVAGALSSYSGDVSAYGRNEGDEWEVQEDSDFFAALNALRECGPSNVGWRIFDSQYAGVAQRRRRVFAVADSRTDRAPEILSFADGLQGHPEPRRQAGEDVAGTLSARTKGGGGLGTDFELDGGLIVGSLQAHSKKHGHAMTTQQAAESGHLIVGAIVASGVGVGGPDVDHGLRGHLIVEAIPFDTTQITSPGNYSAPKTGDPMHPLAAEAHVPAVAFKSSHYTRGKDGAPGEITSPLSADADKGDQDILIAFGCKDYGQDCGPISPTLRSMSADKSHANGGGQVAVAFQCHGSNVGLVVRRLMPVECERLQNFPDGWTEWGVNESEYSVEMSDSFRYRALGNSVTVSVVKRLALNMRAIFEEENGFMAQQTQAMTTKKNRTVYDQARQFLETRESQIMALAPAQWNFKRLTGLVIHKMSQDEYLSKCSIASIYKAVKDAAAVGLEPCSLLQEAALVPFWNKKRNIYEAQFIPMYKGLIAAARRTGLITDISAHIIYDGDTIDIDHGRSDEIHHKPLLTRRHENRVGVWCKVTFSNSDKPHYELMLAMDVEHIKAKVVGRSAHYYGGWVTDEGEMWRKTVVRRAMKYCQATQGEFAEKLAKAIAVDENFEGEGEGDFDDSDVETLDVQAQPAVVVGDADEAPPPPPPSRTAVKAREKAAAAVVAPLPQATKTAAPAPAKAAPASAPAKPAARAAKPAAPPPPAEPEPDEDFDVVIEDGDEGQTAESAEVPAEANESPAQQEEAQDDSLAAKISKLKLGIDVIEASEIRRRALEAHNLLNAEQRAEALREHQLPKYADLDKAGVVIHRRFVKTALEIASRPPETE